MPNPSGHNCLNCTKELTLRPSKKARVNCPFQTDIAPTGSVYWECANWEPCKSPLEVADEIIKELEVEHGTSRPRSS